MALSKETKPSKSLGSFTNGSVLLHSPAHYLESE